MRTVVNEVEVPNDSQRALDSRAIAVTISGGAGTVAVNPSSPDGMPVYIVGGTSTANVTFTGTINTDIGSVKLKDFENNEAVIPHAGDGKSSSTHALVVQHVDPSGSPLYQATQVVVMNNQGTLATQASLLQAISTLDRTSTSLTAVLNNQGTLATEITVAKGATAVGIGAVANNFGTLATSASQGLANSSLAVLVNSQGTQSTASLPLIANNQGTLANQATLAQVSQALSLVMNNQGTLTPVTGGATENTLTRVMNNSGTLANQATLAQVSQTLSLVMNNQGTLSEPPGARDAFDRLRISEPYTLFDSKHLLDAAPHIWDDGTTSGTGASSSYDRVNAKVRLAVTALTAGTRTRRTFRRFNYQPGKSQLILMTFTLGSTAVGITRRVGYFDNFNGLLLQQTGAGLGFVIRKNGLDTVIGQADWNTDKLNGTGPSGLTLDPSKSQIFFVDFEWLGVGSVHFGFLINGAYVPCHTANHANSVSNVYMSAPNLPLSYELSNDGNGAASTLDCICSTVMSEGGSQFTGYPRSVDRGTDPFVTLNNADNYPVIGIRLSSAGTYATLTPVGATIVCTTNSVLRYSLVLNPSISGDAVVWSGINNSAVEYANATNSTGSANVASGGTIVASGYAAIGQPSSQIVPPNNFALGSSLRGVQDELWLCASRLTGTTESLYGSIYFTAQS